MKEEKKCPKCSGTNLVRCSFGALNCPDCFTYVPETKKERKKAINKITKFINQLK